MAAVTPPAVLALRAGAARRALAPCVSIALALLCALLAARAACEQISSLNSDQLYLPDLYDDLFQNGGSWSAWALPPAPSIFPDLVLYAIAARVTHAVGLAWAVAVSIQIVAILALAGRFVRAPSGRAGLPPVGYLASAACLLLLLSAHPMRHDFFSLAHHGGAVVVGLGLAVVWSSAMEDWSLVRGALVTLGSFLGASSDLLVASQFLLPCCLAGAVTVVTGRLAPAALRRPLGAALLGLAPALLVFRSLRAAGIPDGPHDSAPPLVRLGGSVVRANLARLWHGMGLAFAILLVLSVGAAAVVVARALREAPTGERTRTLFIASFFLACMACTLGGPVLTLGADPRYLQPAFLLPALFLPWTIHALGSRVLRAIALPVTAALSIPAAVQVARSGFAAASIHLPYGESTACLDRAAEAGSLEYGFADYWNARYLSFHSRRGLRLSELSPELGPRLWISTRDSYARVTRAHPERIFVVSSGLPAERFAALFGPPEVVTTCPAFDVFTYRYALLSGRARDALGASVR